MNDFLQQLFNSDEWRKQQVAKLPPAQYTNSTGLPFNKRAQTMMPHINQMDARQKTLEDLYMNMNQNGQALGIGEIPKGLWELFLIQSLQDQMKRNPGMI